MAKIYYGTGRRKEAIAKVSMVSGKGKITVNGKEVNEFFPFKTLVMDLMQPLEATNMVDKFDIDATVKGGGFSGQIRDKLCDKSSRAVVKTQKSKDSYQSIPGKKLCIQGTIRCEPYYRTLELSG